MHVPFELPATSVLHAGSGEVLLQQLTQCLEQVEQTHVSLFVGHLVPSTTGDQAKFRRVYV